MDVTRWETPAAFFPWPHVQSYIDRIDAQVYRAAIEFAQEDLGLLAQAKPCPQCGLAASELFWFSVSDAQAAWDAGTGRVGWLTLCERCRLQVDFLIDEDLTAEEAEERREGWTPD